MFGELRTGATEKMRRYSGGRAIGQFMPVPVPR
jgi:hypothetical protein